MSTEQSGGMGHFRFRSALSLVWVKAEAQMAFSSATVQSGVGTDIGNVILFHAGKIQCLASTDDSCVTSVALGTRLRVFSTRPAIALTRFDVFSFFILSSILSAFLFQKRRQPAHFGLERLDAHFEKCLTLGDVALATVVMRTEGCGHGRSLMQSQISAMPSINKAAAIKTRPDQE